MKTSQHTESSPLSVTLTLEAYQTLLDKVDLLGVELEKNAALLAHERELHSFDKEENDRLRWEINYLKRLCWGRSSEKRRLPEDSAQLSICFEEPDGVDVSAVEEEKKEEVAKVKEYSRFRKTFKKKVVPHSRQPIPADLPRKREVIEPAVDLTGAIRMGEEVTERYAVQPKMLYVQQIVRPRYKLADGHIVIAPLPETAHPRSNASDSVLSHIAVAKYADHLPLNRQIEIFSREGVNLPASTISNWMMKAAQCLEPVYNELRELMKSCRYVHADEVPHPVLESYRPGALHHGYMWNFYLPLYKSPYIEYHRGRGSTGLGTLLSGEAKVVQSDGYAIYDMIDKLPGMLHLCCWAHVRRKFVEAELYDPPSARYALCEIGKLYAVEKEIKEKGLEKEEVVKIRQKKSYPVIKALERWSEEKLPDEPPRSPLYRAINYMYCRFEQLSHYINDAGFAIDNNPVERSIRPLTLNRKNCLFSGSHDAAHAAAIFFSLFGACRENEVNPYLWMMDCLSRVRKCAPRDYSALLPHNWKGQNQPQAPITPKN